MLKPVTFPDLIGGWSVFAKRHFTGKTKNKTRQMVGPGIKTVASHNFGDPFMWVPSNWVGKTDHCLPLTDNMLLCRLWRDSRTRPLCVHSLDFAMAGKILPHHALSFEGNHQQGGNAHKTSMSALN